LVINEPFLNERVVETGFFFKLVYVYYHFEEDTHLIIACDGLWDVVDDDKAAEIVMKNKDDPKKAADDLKEAAINNGTTDNVSVMVIKL
jgi:serine/threonine protein phosphatase PrpC